MKHTENPSYKISKHTESDTYMHIYVCTYMCIYTVCGHTHYFKYAYPHTQEREKLSMVFLIPDAEAWYLHIITNKMH